MNDVDWTVLLSTTLNEMLQQLCGRSIEKHFVVKHSHNKVSKSETMGPKDAQNDLCTSDMIQLRRCTIDADFKHILSIACLAMILPLSHLRGLSRR